MQVKDGWLVDARHAPSPHHDCRPEDEAPSLLVVHNISLPPGEFGGPWIDALFAGTLDSQAHPYFAGIAHLRVSAHCLIRRDGEIVQYVPFNKRAWHAGVSCYQGRERCNDFSIGIELEGTDVQPYTDAQYRQLAAVTRTLISLYPAMKNHMTGHSDIAPERKTDPGPAFDWTRFRALVADPSDKEMR
ncbi:1,6-anhydro-N-acetylmuramyl-L-alanine amidase AmpD [Cronobacter malonaticus]|uniref:1,6-anhydro-N-acetylmuramyl-L-alanine amidase AmpD n=1 Tax=Cronobacter malonaticus TaxID=413503 RepID=V5U306_9ENTR|nr:1,6-anhydro-N-acetylmuramyl-L-alanine amidase AmpD [Cronobacter malonaticus]CCJ92605.1 N-acetylmuramoyl-L-alanine amidase AmpD [Cronobacter malonaticus 681]AHB71753.1 N-acetyl-anhydromuranmyl-L-alanine amidase [Cronobacter malonaticus]ALX79838.1 N-acetyl-anhydromuranmyl-L-alanine amidase [Cronobacter malonaticus LMG 23826]EGT4281194.1 1,6-anhydro-N-acetylmuramyl-L-alanine amidase AmpD [Cronobacter malonaticus]EGT4289125.1 1,6-anhydro-N-acetylmuramyl-L-alanine amidase AmpD [Cronobacter malon